MKLYYDFHMHSCLSPCGDEDMTPQNIVNMSKLMGFDVIALTDHNTAKNCPAVKAAAEKAAAEEAKKARYAEAQAKKAKRINNNAT